MRKSKSLISVALKSGLILVMLLIGNAGVSQSGIPQRNPENDPCYTNTVLLWGDVPYENVITLQMGQVVTFHTNEVCDAVEYTWLREDGAQFNTSVPYVTIGATDLIHQQPCSEYESKIVNGAYMTDISVKSDRTNFITVPVSIAGAPACSQTDVPGVGYRWEWPEDEDDWKEVPGSSTGCCDY